MNLTLTVTPFELALDAALTQNGLTPSKQAHSVIFLAQSAERVTVIRFKRLKFETFRSTCFGFVPDFVPDLSGFGMENPRIAGESRMLALGAH
jgi:hypothetical protein